MEIAFQVLAILTGIASAVFWFRAARIPTSTRFNITVVRPHMGPLGGPLGGTYVGQGHSVELDQLGAALVAQSRLNAFAAAATALSVIFQALAIAVHLWK
jgi:hypothetical protein